MSACTTCRDTGEITTGSPSQVLYRQPCPTCSPCPACSPCNDRIISRACGHRPCPSCSEPCTRDLFEGQIIGAACPDCGHTNVVHPGEHNPALDCCVICMLVRPTDEK